MTFESPRVQSVISRPSFTMKKRTLTLERETIRALIPSRLPDIHGGLRVTEPTRLSGEPSCLPDGCITDGCTATPRCTQEIM